MDYQRPFNYNTNLAHWRIEDFPLLKVSTNQGGGDCVLPHCYLELEHIATGYKDWIPLNYKECQLIDQYVYLNKEKTITGINLCIKLLDDRLKREAEDVGQEWFPLEETHFIPTDPCEVFRHIIKTN